MHLRSLHRLLEAFRIISFSNGMVHIVTLDMGELEWKMNIKHEYIVGPKIMETILQDKHGQFVSIDMFTLHE